MLRATDLFTTEVWTATGLTTFYVLFFLQLQTRRVILGGLTPYPKDAWLKQVARNLIAADGPLADARFLLPASEITAWSCRSPEVINFKEDVFGNDDEQAIEACRDHRPGLVRFGLG